MNSGDPFHDSRRLLAVNFVARSIWDVSRELSWSADRIGAVTAMYSSVLLEGLRAAAVPAVAEQLGMDRDAVQLTMDGHTLHWRLQPLEVLVGVSLAVSATPLADEQVAVGIDAGGLGKWLQEQLDGVNTRAGGAVASLIPGLTHSGGLVEPLLEASTTTHNGYLSGVDINTVRSERVPVEFTMLFDMLAGAAQQMMPLSDVLAVAKTMSIDDETVLGCVNYYIDKRYLVYDREHHIIRLTPHGRAAVTNEPKAE